MTVTLAGATWLVFLVLAASMLDAELKFVFRDTGRERERDRHRERERGRQRERERNKYVYVYIYIYILDRIG